MKVVIVGGGTYGQVYLSYLCEDTNFEVAGFLDDNQDLVGGMIESVPVLGTSRDMLSCKRRGIEGVIVPIGNNRARVNIFQRAQQIGLATPNFIHSTATVSRDAYIGKGVYILPGSIVMPFAHLDDYVMVSMNVNIAHHTTLHRGVFLSTGVNMGANIDVGEFVNIGIGAVVMTGVNSIGSDAVVGAGAVVIHDVPKTTTVAGVPARPLQRQ